MYCMRETPQLFPTVKSTMQNIYAEVHVMLYFKSFIFNFDTTASLLCLFGGKKYIITMATTELNLRKTSPSVFIPLILCIVFLLHYTIAQELQVQHQTNTFSNTGPVVTVQCEATFPTGSSQHTVSLLFDCMELAVNENQTIISSRHVFIYFQGSENPNTFKLQLNIKNAVKQDEGLYECQMNYMQDSSVQTLIKTADITIDKYLPASNYPECSIEPSAVLTDGDLATFYCTVGDSNPPVKLMLALIKTDGFIEQLIGYEHGYYNENASVMLPVKADNNTRLVCGMTSDTFPTAYRSCYAGPIKILPQKMLPMTNSITIFPMEITTNSEPATVTNGSMLANKMVPSGAGNVSTWGIVGGVIGVLVASVTFVIIILVMRRSKQPSDENIPMAATSNQMDGSSNSNQRPQAQDHPYTAYQKQPEPEPYAALNQPNVSPSNDQQSADHPYTAYQKQPDPEPYAALNQMPPPNSTAVTPDPDYQNLHNYENNIQMH